MPVRCCFASYQPARSERDSHCVSCKPRLNTEVRQGAEPRGCCRAASRALWSSRRADSPHVGRCCLWRLATTLYGEHLRCIVLHPQARQRYINAVGLLSSQVSLELDRQCIHVFTDFKNFPTNLLPRKIEIILFRTLPGVSYDVFRALTMART